MYDQEKLNNHEETDYQIQQDDEYGLPEAEYSPLEQQQPVAPQEPIRQNREIDLQPQESSSSWPIWAGLIILLAVAGFSLYYFVFNTPEEEIAAPVAVTQPQEPVREEKPEVVEPAPVEDSWTPAPPKEGSVTAITARTGRYYVVVGSFIDGDMAGDYAKKLAAAGRQVTLIEPSGNRKFYRLGIMDAGTFGEASAQLDDLKSTFGQEIWVYKY